MYYSAISDDDYEPGDEYQSDASRKRTVQMFIDKKEKFDDIEKFFEVAPKKKKTKKTSSTVSRACNDGVAYISTNADDYTSASHLVKIEIYDLKKLKSLQPSEHWKHADVRLKYYTNEDVQNQNFQKAKELVYNITNEVAGQQESKKYFFSNKDSGNFSCN